MHHDTHFISVNGRWEPLIEASSKCNITTESLTSEVVITTPYQSSCWKMKVAVSNAFKTLVCACSIKCHCFPQDNKRLLSLQYEDEEWSLSCHNVSYGDEQNDQGHWLTSAPTASEKTPLLGKDTAKQNVHPVPRMYNPYFPMYYYHEPMYDRLPWGAFPNTASNFAATMVSTAVPTMSTTTSTTKPLASQIRNVMNAFPYMYYPFGPMYPYQNPMYHWYPWANPPYTSSSTAKYLEHPYSQSLERLYPFSHMLYPFGLLYHHGKHMHYRDPWSNPTASNTVTSVPTSSTTSSTKISANQYRDLMYPFPHLYYPFGPIHYHQKPLHYRYPLAKPTTATTIAGVPSLSTTSSTTKTVKASQIRDPIYPFPEMYYPLGHVHHHRNPMSSWVYPIATFTAVPTTSTTSSTTKTLANRNRAKKYPIGPKQQRRKPMYHRYPLANPTTTTATITTTAPTTSHTGSTTTHDNRKTLEPMQHVPQRKWLYYPSDSVHDHHKSTQYGYARTLSTKSRPAAVHTSTQTTTQTETTETVSNNNPPKSVYSSTKFYPIAHMPHQRTNPIRQYVHSWSRTTLAPNLSTKSAYTPVTARHSHKKQRFHHKYDLLFDPMHRKKHQTPWVSYPNHHTPKLQVSKRLVPASSTPTTINCVK